MSTPCAHRFDQLKQHPTRGSEIASGTCANCKARLCVHDFLDGRDRSKAATYRFTHPMSAAALSACSICQGNPRANAFEQRRIQPWFDGAGPALPEGWSFLGRTTEKSDQPTT